MGLVYRAYHVDLERTVAVKVLQAISPDADTVARFRHEAQAIAQLRHPNIVNVYDFGAFEGTPYMVVEYIPGGSLSARMSEDRLDRPTALKYLRGIAAGLDYAHRHGVVHRDIKPANVLLTAEDAPVLADFGLAKLLQGSSLKSLTGVTTGTPAYMAPEQVMGHQVGPAADRYSLATIAYEMLTGVIPFDGEALMELLYAQVHRDPLPPSARYPDLGAQVDAVMMRGLAKDPEARWESGTAFVDALESALEGRSVPAAAPAPAVAGTVVMQPALASTVPIASAAPAKRVVAEPAATAVMAYPAAQPARRSRKRLVALLASVAVVLVLIATFALLALARAPSLTLSSTTVAPGEDVVVTASRLPANVNGEIQMYSVLHTFPFRATAAGDVSLDITIPRDIGFGDHLVKLCYNGSCHAQATLHVIQRVAFTTPSPSSSPSAAPSPSPSPTAVPTHPATPTIKPTPPTPVITILNPTVKMVTGSQTVAGFHFAPGSTVTITFVQTTSQTLGSTVTSAQGTWSYTFPMSKVVAVQGYAHVKACGSVNGCYDATFYVSAT